MANWDTYNGKLLTTANTLDFRLNNRHFQALYSRVDNIYTQTTAAYKSFLCKFGIGLKLGLIY